MQGNRDDLALVSAMIGLARVFNRHIVAEGVETAAHGELLIKLGCDHAQGYGIARPMPAESVLPWSLGFTPAPNWALAAQMAESDLAFNA
jgi:EAL domain-containing protein (putative c-di-GMP-specific phosphodiesterase class I)